MTRKARRPSKQPEPDDFSIVVAALRSLHPRVVVPKAELRDPDALAEHVLDARQQLDDGKVRHYLRRAQSKELVELARSMLAREYLLLDARSIADLTIERILDLVRRKKRTTPFRSFARTAMAVIIEAARGDADLAPPTDLGDTADQSAFIQKLAARVNTLGFEARRVVYLALIERAPIDEIVRRTSAPLEHVEWVLETLLGSARAFLAFEATRDDAVEEPPANGRDDDEDEDDGWLEASYGK